MPMNRKDIIELDGEHFLIFEGAKVKVCHVRQITAEKKPTRNDAGQLFAKREPTGALLVNDEQGNTYWQETEDSAWEKC